MSEVQKNLPEAIKLKRLKKSRLYKKNHKTTPEKLVEKIVRECNEASGNLLAHAIPFDLTDLTDLEEEFISQVKGMTRTLDALVNNAGQLIRKPFSAIKVSEARTLFDTNFFAPAQLRIISIDSCFASCIKPQVLTTTASKPVPSASCDTSHPPRSSWLSNTSESTRFLEQPMVMTFTLFFNISLILIL